MERMSTFANLGIDISRANNIQTALADANLDYIVEGSPIYRKWNGTEVENPDFMETVRLTDGHSYGVVSKSYGIVQNTDAFDFVNYINAPISFVKGGETKGGMVYIISKLEDMEILGDKFTPYVLFRNSFNGAYSLDACVCPLRIVCQNQFNISFKETNNTIHLKHSKNINDKMREAQFVLANTVNYLDTLKKKAEQFAGQKLGMGDVSAILDNLFPINEKMSDRQKAVIIDKKTAFFNAYNAEDNRAFRGTAWGIINACTDFYTHEKPVRQTATAEENRFISVTFDPKIMQKALAIVSAKVA